MHPIGRIQNKNFVEINDRNKKTPEMAKFATIRTSVGGVREAQNYMPTSLTTAYCEILEVTEHLLAILNKNC